MHAWKNSNRENVTTLIMVKIIEVILKNIQECQE